LKESLGKMLKTLNYKKLLPYLVLVVLLAFSFLAWQFYNNTAAQEREHRFNHDVDSVLEKITKRLHQIEMFLQSGAGLFIISEEMTMEEWWGYYQYRQTNAFIPGIQGVVFSRVVRPPELAQHIEEIRGEGFPGYTVWPSGDRELYVPVVFIDPCK
jgi:CHASE1-domain containing sensor protein